MAEVNNFYAGYLANYPRDVPRKVAQGVVVTAAINLLYGRSVQMALLGSAIAATATLIEAATRPIIRSIFPDHQFIPALIQITVCKAAAFGIADSIAPWIGMSYKVSSTVEKFIAWCVLNQSCFDRNVAIAEVI